MSSEANPDKPEKSLPILRRADQGCAAALLAVSLLVIGVFGFVVGGHHGGLIDIDHAEPQTIDFQIDINEADWPEFTLLPGIGETLARRIVESRNADGPFVDHDDLQRVRGIGPRTVERIRPYLLPLAKAANVARPE